VRILARKMNERAERTGETPRAQSGELNALGLIHAVLHHVIDAYGEGRKADPFVEIGNRIDSTTAEGGLGPIREAFRRAFPSAAAYRGEASLAEPPGAQEERGRLLRELLVLWVLNRNPAVAPYRELLDEGEIAATEAYGRAVEAIRERFQALPPLEAGGENLVEMLLSPALAVPHSLLGQVEYIVTNWGHLLGDWLLLLLRARDLLSEEAKWGLLGPGEAVVPDYGVLEGEPERFSPDRDWMGRLVLIAKNVHVWLHQLSKIHGRTLTRLDEIPDEALDRLAGWGFTGLWLIGLWERSSASKRIKRESGNPEAMASAYAIHGYTVATDLGGEEAFRNLRERALARGLRMATDMVPNHMGIDSPWVVDHPDRFLSLDTCPYPVYRFDTPDLSWHGDVGIFLEAHYRDRSDAAVVFRRLDRRTGEERFIYHGNDGTSMPWNDTAQLDYLNPETREAVIREILEVARKSPIIRFDAAMTLTRLHYQRLWFPAPGSGGAIPSRAERGLTREAFRARMDEEFWREVVDRVREEAPDTLLLAEAFWLMEGYFVRTLGMHRVYNSAFMNMLKDEDNARYRAVLKNTLAFDPEVLQRFVNFLSNPDEETAVAHFGKGDKYFGVCTLAATLPGLPLFSHGQIEGFHEKYGMEYGRPYWGESPDEGFLQYHEATLFPLLRRRALFADATHFLLYDFFTEAGDVNEDVFAYSNRSGGDRALVVYHNRYGDAAGWIRTSVGFRDKGAEGEGLVQRTLAEGLALTRGEGRYVLFRDAIAGLEYVRSADRLFDEGLFVVLGPYARHVFLDFREVKAGPSQPWDRLCRELDGRGVPEAEEALEELRNRPLREALHALLDGAFLRRCAAAGAAEEAAEDAEETAAEAALRIGRVLEAAKELGIRAPEEKTLETRVGGNLEALHALPALLSPWNEEGDPLLTLKKGIGPLVSLFRDLGEAEGGKR
jgi:glycosidase